MIVQQQCAALACGGNDQRVGEPDVFALEYKLLDERVGAQFIGGTFCSANVSHGIRQLRW